MKIAAFKLLGFWILCIGPFIVDLQAQDCAGVSFYSNEEFLYGRFEVAMRSAAGNGVVSSFFTYNLGLNCTWPVENNEIDIEMTGNTDDVYFTTHYPNLDFYTDIYDSPFNPHESIHDYAMEWEPGIVRWFADGELVNVQDADYVDGLIHAQNIMMNLWASASVGWVGVWDPSIMPVSSEYDYVRYYEYTPGEGDYGTGNNYSFSWEDEFDFLDETRWTVETHGGFGSNYCTFRSTGLEFENGRMIFTMEEDVISELSVPVSFSVDASALDLAPEDVIYLNGTFNSWCGTCEPMTLIEGVWSVSIDLQEGDHEYLFVKNLWEETGGAPIGSECDYLDCDEYANYGFYLDVMAGPVTLETHCWGTCESCTVTSINEGHRSVHKKLLRIIDTLGREVTEHSTGLLIYQYSDGSGEKRMVSVPVVR